ncbi:MAG: hypothetical protein WDN27_01415 [Candidatus Saccharibacteria bacterium]
MTNLSTDTTTTQSQIDGSAAADGPHYWQVRAKFSDGSYSPWSEIWKVTVDSTTPATPTNLSWKNKCQRHSTDWRLHEPR